MRVVVTGARGFIGHHVCADLASRSHDVVGLGRAESGDLGAVQLDGRVLAAPLTELVEGADAIVHLAARLVVDVDAPVEEYLTPNVALTERLLLAAQDNRVERFVFASSRLVYSSTLGRPATEQDRAVPTTAYGLSKLFAEQLVEAHTLAGRISGVSLRIGQVTGPGDVDRGVVPGFVRAATSGGPIAVVGEGRAVRDFVDVRDVARAVTSAVETATTVPAINIGGGEGLTIRQLALVAARAAGLGPDAVQHSTVHDEDRSHWALDITLAAAQLGWTPNWSIEASMRDRIARSS